MSAKRKEVRTADLYINSKGAEASIKELAGDYRRLKNDIAKLSPTSQEFIDKSAELKKVSARLKDVNAQTRNVRSGFSKIKGLLGPLGLAMGGAFVVRKIIAFGNESRKAYEKQAQAIAQVEQAIKSTDEAAGLSLDELKAKASDLQKSTLFGDEMILKNATGQLLTFTNIAGDNFLRTQQVALDVATVLSTELVPSANEVKGVSLQLGKALNDPAKNLSALSRAGIQFTDDQIKVIKHLQETNRLSEAQEIILTELEKQYGGQAEAAAMVADGSIQMSNAWGDTMEIIGGGLNNVLEPLIKWFTGILLKFNEWLSTGPSIREWFAGLYNGSTLLRGAMQSVVAIVTSAIDVLSTLWKMADALLDGRFSEMGDILVEGGKSIAGNFVSAWNETIDGEMQLGPSEDQAKKEHERIKKQAQENAQAVNQISEKELKEREKLQKRVQDLLNKHELDLMDANEREIQLIRDKYQKLLEEDLLNEEQKRLLEEARNEEIALKEQEQELKEAEKREKELADRQAHMDEIHLATLSDYDREIYENQVKFDKLIDQAKKYGLDTTALIKAKQDQEADITKKHNENLTKDEQKILQERLASRQSFLTDLSSVIESIPEEWGAAKDALKPILVAEASMKTYDNAVSAYKSQIALATPDAPIRATLAAAAATAQGLAAIARIKAFDTGGYTSPLPGLGADQSGLKPAGIVHEGEWVAPPWMVQDPMYSNQIRMLEMARSNRMRGYDSGGDVVLADSSGSSFDVQDQSIQDTSELTTAVMRLNAILDRGIPAIIDRDGQLDLRDSINEINQLEEDSRI